MKANHPSRCLKETTNKKIKYLLTVWDSVVLRLINQTKQCLISHSSLQALTKSLLDYKCKDQYKPISAVLWTCSSEDRPRDLIQDLKYKTIKENSYKFDCARVWPMYVYELWVICYP